MGIFKKKTVKPVPEECRGMEIKIMSSTCTGEKTIKECKYLMNFEMKYM